ncbi:hypothetical protein SOVF_164160 isoform B [Spinacia oleracea]|nr:hypothetical protein SOVF_164160 isoform B [Spinacia oleracea]
MWQLFHWEEPTHAPIISLSDNLTFNYDIFDGTGTISVHHIHFGL